MVRSNNRQIQGAVLALLLNILASQAFAAYDPAFCQSVAGTLNIHWQAVAGPFSPCTGIEITDGSLADAEDGSIVMSGTSVSDPVCLVTGEYEFSLSADTTQLVGSDTFNNIPMTLTRGPEEECFVGTWSFGRDVYEAHIWADAFVEFDTGNTFEINAGISDAWFYPVTSGQGFFIIVWEEQKTVFLAWFTYDTERPPDDVTAILGEPGHRWITALGPYDGDTASLDVYLSSGMIFDSGVPPVDIMQYPGATMEIVWSSCKAGIVKYNIPSLNLIGEVPIQRIVEDNVAACEAAQPQ